jgi:hypothetical protein
MNQKGLTFKDAILKERATSEFVGEKKYDYDEAMRLVNSLRCGPIKQISKSTMHLYEFLDEQSERMTDIIEHMKMSYANHGFMTEFSYSDMYNLLEKYTSVEEIKVDFDENELSGEDDEII